MSRGVRGKVSGGEIGGLPQKGRVTGSDRFEAGEASPAEMPQRKTEGKACEGDWALLVVSKRCAGDWERVECVIAEVVRHYG